MNRRWVGVPWLAVSIAALALLVAASPAVGAAFEYRPRALAEGEVWRIVTAHLVHFTPQMLFWNVAGFVALAVFAERGGRRATAETLGVAAVAIPAALALLQPELANYGGLSGLASALFGLVAVRLVGDGRRAGDPWRAMLAIAFCIGFALKIGFEWTTHEPVFVSDFGVAVDPVPLAHAVGLLVGATIGAAEEGGARRAATALAR